MHVIRLMTIAAHLFVCCSLIRNNNGRKPSKSIVNNDTRFITTSRRVQFRAPILPKKELSLAKPSESLPPYIPLHIELLQSFRDNVLMTYFVTFIVFGTMYLVHYFCHLFVEASPWIGEFIEANKLAILTFLRAHLP